MAGVIYEQGRDSRPVFSERTMQFDNIRVSRKLWGMFLVLMVTMLVI